MEIYVPERRGHIATGGVKLARAGLCRTIKKARTYSENFDPALYFLSALATWQSLQIHVLDPWLCAPDFRLVCP